VTSGLAVVVDAHCMSCLFSSCPSSGPHRLATVDEPGWRTLSVSLDATTTLAAPDRAWGLTVAVASGADNDITYEFPNEAFLGHHVAPQLRVGSGNLRSPKRIQGNFAVESFMDELAAAAGAGPAAFRIPRSRTRRSSVLAMRQRRLRPADLRGRRWTSMDCA